MRLDAGCLLLLAGAACALPSGDGVQTSHAVRRQAAAAVVRPAIIRPAASALARPAAKADTAAKVDTAAKADTAAIVEAVKAVDPVEVVETVKMAIENADKEELLEGFLASTRASDLAPIVKDIAIPLAIEGLEQLDKFSGERVLAHIAATKGHDLLEYARRSDMSVLWKVYDSLNVSKVVKQLYGIDISRFITQLKSLSGANLLEVVQALPGKQVADWLFSLLQLIRVDKIVEAIGFDLRSILEGLMPDGAKVLAKIEAFDGAVFLKKLQGLNGPELANKVNRHANAFLTMVRDLTSRSINKPAPGPYKSFDVLKTIDVLQSLFESLSGLKFPSVSNEWKSWSGARQVEQIRKFGFSGLVNGAITVFKLGTEAAGHAAAIGSKLAGHTAETRLEQPVVQAMLEVTENQTGTKILQEFQKFNAKALVNAVKGSGAVELVRDLTAIDIGPYLDVFANFNPTKFLNNVNKMTGSRMVKLIDDLGVTEYLNGFPGVDFKSMRVLLNAASGRMLIAVIKKFNGKEFLKQASALSGVNLEPAASTAGAAPGAKA